MLQLSQLKSRGELGPVWPADNPLNHSVGSALTSWPVLSYSFNLGGAKAGGVGKGEGGFLLGREPPVGPSARTLGL